MGIADHVPFPGCEPGARAVGDLITPLAPPQTQNSKPKTVPLPDGSGVVLCVTPRRFGIGPGLNALIFLKRFSDLIPSIIVAGSVIATTQSKCG
jgi:hypothetical protein